MGRKAGKQAPGRYKNETSWRLNTTILNKGVTAAGSIIYKGKHAESGQHRFLLRCKWSVDLETKQASTTITAATASDAERMLAAWVQEIRNGRIVPRVMGTFASYVEDVWFIRRLPRVAGSTYSSECGHWNARIKPFLGHLRIDQLSNQILNDWIATNASSPTITRKYRQVDGSTVEKDVKLSNGSRVVRNAKALLTTILNDMVDEGYLPASPMPARRKRKSRKERVSDSSTLGCPAVEYWTREEVAEFWARGRALVSGAEVLKYRKQMTAAERDQGKPATRIERMDPYGAATCFLFGAFGLAFGTRPGEGCAARWSDLVESAHGWDLNVSAAIGYPDADQFVLADSPTWDRTLTKTGVKANVADLSGFVVQFLLPFKELQKRLIAQGRLKNPHGYIFVRPDGTFYNPVAMRRKWLHLLNGLNLRHLTPYGLRHTHATLLLEEGVSLNAISSRLRHADVLVTAQVYAHVTARLKHQTAVRVVSAGLIPVPAENASQQHLGARTGDDVVDMLSWKRNRRHA